MTLLVNKSERTVYTVPCEGALDVVHEDGDQFSLLRVGDERRMLTRPDLIDLIDAAKAVVVAIDAAVEDL